MRQSLGIEQARLFSKCFVFQVSKKKIKKSPIDS